MANGLTKYIKIIFDSVLSIVYSEIDECPLCKNPMEETSLCQICISKIKFIENPFIIHGKEYSFKCYSVALYSNYIIEMIIRLKYKSDFQCGKALGKLLSEKILENKIDSYCLTYVPMSKKSFKNRGYNQSEYLAKVAGECLNLPVFDTLIKNRETLDQIGLGGDERWNNVNNCFQIGNKNKIKSKKIILIDDVITTGATAYNCAKELMDSGAKEINILTVARSNV